MNLQDELRLRTANSTLTQIALVMKYNPRNAVQAGNRIHTVINSPSLALDSGSYDFKFTDKQFVLKLCEVLNMDMAECSCQIEKISDELFEWRMAYKPWIFIDTDFHRTVEGIITLMFMDSIRRIKLDDEIAKSPLFHQIEKAKPIIIQHFQDNDGRLPLWGTIQRYKYFYAENQSITFDTGGHVVEAVEGSVQPRAKLTHKGHDITKIILE